jgi:hypothetical protein
MVPMNTAGEGFYVERQREYSLNPTRHAEGTEVAIGQNTDQWGAVVQGPYKQFKGKSRNTGPITLVLYEDPPDAIPKIHIM